MKEEAEKKEGLGHLAFSSPSENVCLVEKIVKCDQGCSKVDS